MDADIASSCPNICVPLFLSVAWLYPSSPHTGAHFPFTNIRLPMPPHTKAWASFCPKLLSPLPVTPISLTTTTSLSLPCSLSHHTHPHQSVILFSIILGPRDLLASQLHQNHIDSSTSTPSGDTESLGLKENPETCIMFRAAWVILLNSQAWKSLSYSPETGVRDPPGLSLLLLYFCFCRDGKRAGEGGEERGECP